MPGGLRTAAAAAAMALTLLAGCATLPPPPPPLSYAEIITMLRSQRAQTEVIAEIRQRGVAASPTATDVDAITQAGGSQAVVDAVLIADWQPPATARAPDYGYPYYDGYGPVWPWFGFWGYRSYRYPHGPVYRPGYPAPIPRPAPSPGPGVSKPSVTTPAPVFKPSIPKPTRGR